MLTLYIIIINMVMLNMKRIKLYSEKIIKHIKTKEFKEYNEYYEIIVNLSFKYRVYKDQIKITRWGIKTNYKELTLLELSKFDNGETKQIKINSYNKIIEEIEHQKALRNYLILDKSKLYVVRLRA